MHKQNWTAVVIKQPLAVCLMSVSFSRVISISLDAAVLNQFNLFNKVLFSDFRHSLYIDNGNLFRVYRLSFKVFEVFCLKVNWNWFSQPSSFFADFRYSIYVDNGNLIHVYQFWLQVFGQFCYCRWIGIDFFNSIFDDATLSTYENANFHKKYNCHQQMNQMATQRSSIITIHCISLHFIAFHCIFIAFIQRYNAK